MDTPKESTLPPDEQFKPKTRACLVALMSSAMSGAAPPVHEWTGIRRFPDGGVQRGIDPDVIIEEAIAHLLTSAQVLLIAHKSWNFSDLLDMLYITKPSGPVVATAMFDEAFGIAYKDIVAKHLAECDDCRAHYGTVEQVINENGNGGAGVVS